MNSGQLLKRRRLGLIMALVMSLISLLVARISSAGEFAAKTIGDYRNVTVMEVTGNYDRKTTDGAVNSDPRSEIAKEFFRTHPDDYDFLFIYTNFDFQMGDARAFYMGVQNDVQGIGENQFDHSESFGSHGQLQGTIDMGNIANLVTDPLDPKFEETLYTLSHELMHRWGAHTKFIDDSGYESSALLGKDNAHWSFLLNSGGSVLYGNDWRDNGDGTFTTTTPPNRNEMQFYSPLDLYLMGMYDKTQVPPMLLIDSPGTDPTRMPEAGVTVTGTAHTVTIDDIIALMGERVPAAADSQKEFKAAYIFATRPSTFTGDEQNKLYGIETIRKAWATRFSIVTDGKAIMDIDATANGVIPTNPGIVEPLTSPRAVPSSIEEGIDWLKNKQKSDGSWQSLSQTTIRDTAEALLALQGVRTAQSSYDLGLKWLGNAQAGNVDYLARQIMVSALAQRNVQRLTAALIQRQNPDGGWGGNGTYKSTAVDTAFAMLALQTARYTDNTVLSKAAGFLLTQQSADGGWSFSQGSKSYTYSTAVVMQALQYLPDSNLTLVTAINRAASFLLACQNADGGFGSSPSTVYETAMAYIALSGAESDNIVLWNAVAYLQSQQSLEGSWLNDPYSTALAVRVLSLAQNGPAPPPQPTTGTITGWVTDATSKQPLSGVLVALQSDQNIQTNTDATGAFTLYDVPPGSQTITVEFSGYTPTTATALVAAGGLVSSGIVSLTPVQTKGIIKGLVTDAETAEPLSGVLISVTGSYTGSVKTGADGTFKIVDVTPGQLTISASKTGCATVSETGTVTAGNVLFFSPRMKLPPPTTGTIIGWVVNEATGVPLMGVSATMADATEVTDDRGIFRFYDVPAGNHSITLSRSGFASSIVNANVVAGSITHMRPLLLAKTAATKGTITGLATDGGDNNAPLSDVIITFIGNLNGKAVCNSDGRFTVTGVPSGTVTMTASKEGYYPTTMTGTVNAGGVLFFNAALTKMPQSLTTITLTGKVVDGTGGQSLANATVVLQSNPAISASTDTEGKFILNNIPYDDQKVNISNTGYATTTVTLMSINLPAASVIDLGSLALWTSPQTATVQGKVMDSTNNRPLQGVEVSVYNYGTDTVENTASESNGSFKLSGIKTGDTDVYITTAGYGEMAATQELAAGEVLHMNAWLPLMSPNPAGSHISGVVVDSTTQQPLAGVTVSLADNEYITAQTDEKGKFTLYDVPYGEHDIVFSSDGYSILSMLVNAPGGLIMDLGTLPMTMNPAVGMMRGLVTDAASGIPIDRATVKVTGAHSGSVSSGAEGRFVMSGITAGEITLTVSKPGYNEYTATKPITAGNVTNFDVQLTASASQTTTGTIIGRVVDSATGLRLDGVLVTVDNNLATSTLTDSYGNFSLADIPPGTHTVTFAHAGYGGIKLDALAVAAGENIDLGSVPLSSNTLTGAIAGRVTDAASGLPLEDVLVSVPGAFSISDTAGHYRMADIVPGEVIVTVAKNGYFTESRKAVVMGGSLLMFDTSLLRTTQSASLAGKVYDSATNLPISGAVIQVGRNSFDLANTESYLSDANGVFSVNSIRPGECYITVTAAGHVTQKFRIMATAGTTADMQTIHMTPATDSTTITGTVVNALSGAPVQGADVTIDGTNLRTITDSNGVYAIPGIYTLEFNVKVTASGYYTIARKVSLTEPGVYTVDLNMYQQIRDISLELNLNTDENNEYGAYSTVDISAYIQNNRTKALLKGSVEALLQDYEGNIIDILRTEINDLMPGDGVTVSLPWETKTHAPGLYRIFVKVKEAGVGAVVVANGTRSFGIRPTRAVERIDLIPIPMFTHVGATEEIKIQAIIVNRSNVDMELGVLYEWVSPGEEVLHTNSSTVAMSVNEETKSVQLDSFRHSFAESGDYPLRAAAAIGQIPPDISSSHGDGEVPPDEPENPVPDALIKAGSISVAPAVRIESNKSLTPYEVIPGGDKKLRMNIHLKGAVSQ